MNYGRLRRKFGRESDDVTLSRIVRITLGGNDHAQGVIRAHVEFEAAQFADGRGPEECEKIVFNPWQYDLGFGIAEARVVFDDARARRRQHDANE